MTVLNFSAGYDDEIQLRGAGACGTVVEALLERSGTELEVTAAGRASAFGSSPQTTLINRVKLGSFGTFTTPVNALQQCTLL